MDNVRCVNQGDPKDTVLVINQGTMLAIQAKGHYCSLDTVCNMLCALGHCLAELCAYFGADERR